MAEFRIGASAWLGVSGTTLTRAAADALKRVDFQ
jgi:hypothetical protein